MKAELIQDKDDPASYRVEQLHPETDGRCEVAIFSGADALDRAVHFACTYYEDWADPAGLAGY